MRRLALLLVLMLATPCLGIERNVASQKIYVTAVDTSANTLKTGDAANITVYVAKDGGSLNALADTSASEVSSTNAPGSYVVDLAQAETNAVTLLFSGKSTTGNIAILPKLVTTTAPNFGLTVIDSSGRIDTNDKLLIYQSTVSSWNGGTNTITFPGAFDTTLDMSGQLVVIKDISNGNVTNIRRSVGANGFGGTLQLDTATDFTPAAGDLVYVYANDRLLSLAGDPNGLPQLAGDGHLDVSIAYIGGSITAATNLEAAYDGSGYAGGTIKQRVVDGSGNAIATEATSATILVDTGTNLPADIAGISVGASPGLLATGTITVNTPTEVVLSAGPPDNGGIPAGSMVRFTDQSDPDQKAIAYVAAYVGSTKILTLVAAPAFALVTGDSVDVMAANFNLAADAVNSTTIATNAIGATEVGDGAIDAAAIADNAIDSGAFATDAITAGKIQADAIASSELAATAVDEFFDEALAGHTTAGTAGKGITDAASAGDPWSTLLPGSYATGTAGKQMSDVFEAVDGAPAYVEPPTASENAGATASAILGAAKTDWDDTDTIGEAINNGGDGTTSIDPQDVADAMKLAPTAGAAAAGSVQTRLQDAATDVDDVQSRLPPALDGGKMDSNATLTADETFADQLADSLADTGIFVDVEQEPVPDDRTFRIIRRREEGLVGDVQKVIRVGVPASLWQVNLSGVAAANGRIATVENWEIVTGTAGGLTFGTPKRDKANAKSLVTAVTAGTYTVRVEFAWAGGGSDAAIITFKAVN